MASAARAYRPSKQAARADMRVVRGRADAGLSSRTIALARLAMVAAVLLAVVGCVRIGLTAATVDTALAAENLTAQVNNMQSYGAGLEVKGSSLSSPARVRSVAASELGMSAPESSDVIALGGEDAVVDSAGNLSLSQSLAKVAQG